MDSCVNCNECGEDQQTSKYAIAFAKNVARRDKLHSKCASLRYAREDTLSVGLLDLVNKKRKASESRSVICNVARQSEC